MKQNTHNNIKNHAQEITWHTYIHYFGLIALSTVCIVLLCTDDHSTDTGLEQSTPLIQFSTCSAVCSYNPPYAVYTCSPLHNTRTRCDTSFSLSVRWPYVLLIQRLEASLNFPAALMSEASQFATLLGTVALCYSIYHMAPVYLGNTFQDLLRIIPNAISNVIFV